MDLNMKTTTKKIKRRIKNLNKDSTIKDDFDWYKKSLLFIPFKLFYCVELDKIIKVCDNRAYIEEEGGWTFWTFWTSNSYSLNEQVELIDIKNYL